MPSGKIIQHERVKLPDGEWFSRSHLCSILINDGAICFYTGKALKKFKSQEARNKHAWHLTKEHLLSKALYKNQKGRLRVLSLVPCAFFVNSLIGNAPLKVKFALKEHLASIVVFPLDYGLTDIYTQIIETFLAQYSKYGTKCWMWKGYNGSKNENLSIAALNRRRQRLKDMYTSLLTSEERALIK